MSDGRDVPEVLIVDDDADIRELVAHKLRLGGYAVRTAPDGDEGLRAALAEPPDLILLDVMMPRLTGLEVCRALRRNAELSDVPIIMLTAKAHDRDVAESIELGATDYVVKPFSPRELVQRVDAVLGRGGEA